VGRFQIKRAVVPVDVRVGSLFIAISSYNGFGARFRISTPAERQRGRKNRSKVYNHFRYLGFLIQSDKFCRALNAPNVAIITAW